MQYEYPLDSIFISQLPKELKSLLDIHAKTTAKKPKPFQLQHLNASVIIEVINTKNSSNAKFILELVKKLGESGKILTEEQQEDYFLGALMNKEKTGVKVLRSTIFKKLKK